MAFNLRRADRVVTQIYDDAFRPLGLRGTQFAVLLATRSTEPVTMSKLAERLAMDRTTLSRNVRPLMKQKWLGTAAGSDRRERCLSLTPEGQRLLVKAHGAWESAQERIAGILGGKNMAALVERLITLTGKALGE